MKNVCIHLRLEVYLARWLTATMGDPVRFPAHSYENAVLSRLLTVRPKNLPPPKPEAGEVAIVIPDNAARRPEYYNYLGARSQAALRDVIDALFRIHLWSECAPLLSVPGRLNSGLDEWCARHGIPLDNREAVRQKFYRMRKNYEQFGIYLGKKYKKRCHDGVVFRTSSKTSV